MPDTGSAGLTALGLPALVRLLCVLPLLGMLWTGVFWAMG